MKKVALLLGGISSEREISLKTGLEVYKALKFLGYKVKKIDPAEDDYIKILKNGNFDVVFIALHGKFGEDGKIQSFLEMIDLPYTGSSSFASALCMHKGIAKLLFSYNKINTPEYKLITPEKITEFQEIKKLLGLPFVVKPCQEGSSIGVSIVKSESEYRVALDLAFSKDREVLIEKYIKGKEITVGFLGNVPLPQIELIITNSSFYDFKEKYGKNGAKHLIPPTTSDFCQKKCVEIGYKAIKVLNCSGIVRVDFKVDEKEIPYILEINTLPGMTETSLVPDAARYAGMNFPQLVETIIQLAYEKNKVNNPKFLKQVSSIK